MPRPDPPPAAKALVEALPALLDRTSAAGDSLALAVHGMKNELSDAKRVINLRNRAKAISSASEFLRRLGG